MQDEQVCSRFCTGLLLSVSPWTLQLHACGCRCCSASVQRAATGRGLQPPRWRSRAACRQRGTPQLQSCEMRWVRAALVVPPAQPAHASSILHLLLPVAGFAPCSCTSFWSSFRLFGPPAQHPTTGCEAIVPMPASHLTRKTMLLCGSGAAVSALSQVEEPYAWLEDPLPQSTGADPGSPGDSPPPPLLTLETLRRELAMASAGVALGLSGPEACKRRSAGQLLQQLLAAGEVSELGCGWHCMPDCV